MMPDFELFESNAPDSVILSQMSYISECEESGIEVPCDLCELIKQHGYIVNYLGSHDTMREEDADNITSEAFDYYDI